MRPVWQVAVKPIPNIVRIKAPRAAGPSRGAELRGLWIMNGDVFTEAQFPANLLLIRPPVIGHV